MRMTFFDCQGRSWLLLSVLKGKKVSFKNYRLFKLSWTMGKLQTSIKGIIIWQPFAKNQYGLCGSWRFHVWKMFFQLFLTLLKINDTGSVFTNVAWPNHSIISPWNDDKVIFLYVKYNEDLTLNLTLTSITWIGSLCQAFTYYAFLWVEFVWKYVLLTSKE